MNPSVQALRKKFAEPIKRAVVSCGDTIVYVEAGKLHDVIEFLKTDPGQDYSYLVDVTAVEYRDVERPLELVYELFSMQRGAPLRVKVELDKSDELVVE